MAGEAGTLSSAFLCVPPSKEACAALGSSRLRCGGQTKRRRHLKQAARTGGSVLSGAGTARTVVAQSTSTPVEAPVETTSSSPGTPETRVEVSQLTKDTLTLRGRSQQRLKFEVEYGLQAGTSENSYLIQGPDATALVDVPDQAFVAAFSEALTRTVDVSKLDYLVVGHISPKRVECVAQLGKLVQQKKGKGLKVYGSNPACQILAGALPPELIEVSLGKTPVLELCVVRPGDTLDLGGGHVLEFILTPTPRWPDGMVTYDPASRLLFSQKLFSAHICRDDVYDIGGWDVYGEHWRFFFDCMLAPVAKQTEAVLAKLPVEAVFAPPSYQGKTGLGVLKADLGYIWSSVLSVLNLSLDTTVSVLPSTTPASGGLSTAALCPMHGPVVRSSLTELVREYKQWTAERVKQAAEATVAVIYASAYGNTSALAQAISRGLLRGGVGVESVNCEQSTKDEIVDVVRRCSGFVVGSPTLGGHMPTPVQEALGLILQDSTARAKPAGVFGSFGWSGEAVDEIEQRLKDGGFSLAFPSIRCKFKPTEAMLQVCEESGRDLSREVRKRQAKARAQEAVSPSTAAAAAAASGAQQAVGRVVGSLCVLSAVKGDAESAMLASWVSQASFNPPGITVAVAKERAVESLVLPGASFAISVLGEGKAGPISKQLLKKFAPGEPRFGDLPVHKAKNGATILDDAIAALECTVSSRMETGDHWVLYATVDDGQLQDEKGLTAIHHRKVGTRY